MIYRCAALLAALLLASGCGSSSPGIDADSTLRALVETNLTNPGVPEGTTIESTKCVADGDKRWQCIVKAKSPGEPVVSIGGTMTCDGHNCIWKPDA